MKRGGPIQRRTPLRAKTGLRFRSRRMAARYTERRRLVEHMLAMRPWCEARVEGVCTGRSEHVHEPKTRARSGDILDPRNAVTVCGACHSWIHGHPVQAHELGLLVWSWETA